jgi:hypothetical protein
MTEARTARWIKESQVFRLPAGLPWASSHAALPVIEGSGDLRRVYFSARDASDRARIGWFELRLSAPQETLTVSATPTLDIGPLGSFDDSGVTTACLVESEGRRHLYYSGWTRGASVPFYFFVGLAVSEDGLSFQRFSNAPILERSMVDPYLTASPSVIVEGGRWRMWYVSGTGWRLVDGRPRPSYHIKYAESADGFEWIRTGVVCIDYASADEYAIGRPWVLKDGSRYRMWYCYRGSSYRIGYAESGDGLAWDRQDDRAGIETSPGGWDSTMLAYPCVFPHDGRLYMLYNGNDYGRTGIGLAVLDESGLP